MVRESEGVEGRAMRVRDATLESTTEACYPEPPDREVKRVIRLVPTNLRTTTVVSVHCDVHVSYLVGPPSPQRPSSCLDYVQPILGQPASQATLAS